VGVVGCRVWPFPAAAVGLGMRRWASWHNALLTHEAMARERWIDSPLAHGSAMVRRRLLERVGGWRDRGWPEDLDLWLRLFAAGERFAKLPRALYAWRQHRESATRVDPRYRRERFIALRLDALRRGPLRDARSATLVGVGRSLAEWDESLRRAGVATQAIEHGRPSAGRGTRLAPPIVLVFGAAPARDRWRAVLVASGLVELRDFVFVA
jgi:hypothetical protein